MADDEILVKFRADLDDLKRDLKKLSQEGSEGFKEVNKQLKETTKEQKKAGQEASSLGNMFSSLQNKIITAFSVNAIINFTAKLFEMQDALEQVDRKAKVVFRESLPAMEEEANKTANAIGLTKSEFLDASASITLFLKNTGFATDEASKMAKELLKVSSNLSLMNSEGKDAKTIALDLARSLQGNTRSLKDYGFNIKLSQEEMNELMDATEGTNDASKKKATTLKVLNEIMAQSVNITGDLNDELFKSEKLEREAEAGLRERMEYLARASEGIKSMWLDIKIATVDFLNAFLSIQGNEDFIKSLRVIDNAVSSDINFTVSPATNSFDPNTANLGGVASLTEQDLIEFRKLTPEMEKYNKELNNVKKIEEDVLKLALKFIKAFTNKNTSTEIKEQINEIEIFAEAYKKILELKTTNLKAGTSHIPLFDLTKPDATGIGLTQPAELTDEDAFDTRSAMIENEITMVGLLNDAWGGFFDSSINGWLGTMDVMGKSERQIVIMEKIAGASKMTIEYLIQLFKLKALKNTYLASGNPIGAGLAQTQIFALNKNFLTGLVGLSAIAIPEIAFASSQRKYATGKEFVDGLGTSTSDSVPAWLSKGERVVKASDNMKYWDELSAIHNGYFDKLVNDKYVMPQVLSALHEASTGDRLFQGMLMQKWKGENIVSELYKGRVQDKQLTRELIDSLKVKRQNKRTW